MNNEIVINNTPLEIKEFNGQRVVTLKDIDTVHNRPDGTAKRNFNINRDRFIDGEDFFILKPSDIQKDEFRTSEINNRGTIFVTESGYLMLVKSFTDDLAWSVQRQLVRTYFRAKALESYLIDDPIRRAERWIEEQKERLALQTTVDVQKRQIAEMKPKAKYCDTVLNSKGLFTINSIAKDYGKSAVWLNKWLHAKQIQYKQGEVWMLYQAYANNGYTQSKTSTFIGTDGEQHSKSHTYWTPKGRLFLYELLKENGILPLIERGETNDKA